MLEKFLEETVMEVEKKMGEGYQVGTDHVWKNNGLELDGILIMREGENISPAIYLNDYYEEYKQGRGIDSIADEVIEGYHQHMSRKGSWEADLDISYGRLSGQVFYRLVNYRENQKKLEDMPHIPFLDLAVTFGCLMEKREDVIGTLPITNRLMEEWGVGVEKLWELAAQNTPTLFPEKIHTMDEMIEEMLKKDMERLAAFQKERNLPDGDMEEARRCYQVVLEALEERREIPIYVMTNQMGINGAAVLLYEKALSDFSRERQSDFYILPSSIHEILLIPCNGGFGRGELEELVCQVNRTQVAREDLLSNEVYLYHREGNCLEWEGKLCCLPL